MTVQLVAHDLFDSKIFENNSSSLTYITHPLIGGVDVSFVKEDDNIACACLVVLSFPELEVINNLCERISYI